jgi:hypothetical protein
LTVIPDAEVVEDKRINPGGLDIAPVPEDDTIFQSLRLDVKLSQKEVV